ncbi:MAG: hypothetical protein A3F67_06205 [Verrucomicrobia bacterium RIFCSPHIGHO2_12_FULL_41_10]|nr:MAG: hypothetical protein A3F67_06205 [Verrucomicrobia bacterium RIFCSPHIGHO2_12_FULL_41_10]HLB33160.1 hypothetical protein [Chthoniobacterales bacterium]
MNTNVTSFLRNEVTLVLDPAKEKQSCQSKRITKCLLKTCFKVAEDHNANAQGAQALRSVQNTPEDFNTGVPKPIMVSVDCEDWF